MEVSIETSMSKQITKIKMLSHTNKGILLNNAQNCVMDKLYLMEFRSEFRVEIVEKGHLAYLLTQRWLLVN